MDAADAIENAGPDQRTPDARPARRPDGVTLLALLAASTTVLVPIARPTPLVAAFGGLGIVTIVAISLVLAYGLWELRPWAWPLAILFWLAGFLDALALLSMGTANTNLIVAPIVFTYLNQPEIRRIFGRQGERG